MAERRPCSRGCGEHGGVRGSGLGSNEAALGDAQRDLETLECDGRSIDERTHELNNRRRECESAETALAEIDAALGRLPADAPARPRRRQRRSSCSSPKFRRPANATNRTKRRRRRLLQQGPYSSLAVAEERVRQLEVEEAAETARLDAIARLRAAVERAKAKALSGIAEPVERGATELLERMSGGRSAGSGSGEGMRTGSLQPEGAPATPH